jgi:hypothetical protein
MPSPQGASVMASPGARKGLAGKSGELTPARQRGGRGLAPSLTHLWFSLGAATAATSASDASASARTRPSADC